LYSIGFFTTGEAPQACKESIQNTDKIATLPERSIFVEIFLGNLSKACLQEIVIELFIFRIEQGSIIFKRPNLELILKPGKFNIDGTMILNSSK
jgi:hypothetical protein